MTYSFRRAGIDAVETVHVLLNVFAHDFIVLVCQCLCLLDGVVNLLHVALKFDDALVN